MSNASSNKIARGVFSNICAALDEKEYRYARDEEDLRINFTLQGDGIPVEIYFNVDDEREFVQLLSPLPFSIPENKRAELAIAISLVNNHLANGSFDFDFNKGMIVFRMTTSYIDSILGRELFNYMLRASVLTVDQYSDKFMMLGKETMTLEQFFEFDANR